MIPFNKPYLTGKELENIAEAVQSGHISGNGMFTKKCHDFFKTKYGFDNCLLTTSCTDALEMASILIDIEPGDEVIMPTYTFVSTANSFALRGAKIVFADSYANHPNIDPSKIETLITSKTKAIVVVHYAGIACDMDALMEIAMKHNLFVVEDAAQAINSYYKDTPLGSIGDLGTFSFHETKNIISGEGGLLTINNKQFAKRAEIIWEKGTNRSAFFRGEIDKYGWVDIGSSFLPSEVVSAFLYAQLENLPLIQEKRLAQWNQYFKELKHLENKGILKLPVIPDYATNNGHIFYLIVENIEVRSQLIKYIKENGVLAVFHYMSLHKSDYFKDKYKGGELKNADQFTDCLVRLPLFYELSQKDISFISNLINEFFEEVAE